MKQYRRFYDMDLSDTGLFNGPPRFDVTYKRLLQQGIYDVGNLFFLYDNDMIDYGKNNMNYEVDEMLGVINLVRYKYLKKPLQFIPSTDISYNRICEDKEEVYKIIQGVGLSFPICIYIIRYIISNKLEHFTLQDAFMYLDTVGYNGRMPASRKEMYKERVKVFLDYCDRYNKQKEEKQDVPKKEKIIDKKYTIENYDELKYVLLNETGLMMGNPKRNVTYRRLNDQGIETLYDLFTRYDNGTIEYGKSTVSCATFEANEVEGVVQLLRYKYLDIPLSINPFTNLSELALNEDRKKIMYYLQSIGLPHKACLYSYFWINKQYDKKIKLIDLLYQLKMEKIYVGKYPDTYQEILNEKVRLLLEYSENVIANNLPVYELIEDIPNRWYEIMTPSQVQAYREYKKQEVSVFNNVDWANYNDAMLLDDEDFYTYIKLKNKIKSKIIK